MPNPEERTRRLLRPVAGGLLAATAALSFLTACGDDDGGDESPDMSPTSEMMTPSDTMAPSDSMPPRTR